MSNYRNIEINLLPPELQPPPTVRTAVILNAAIIVGVLAYMAVSTFKTFNDIRLEQQQIKDNEQLIHSKQPVVEMYSQLSEIKEKVDKYGRLVSLASVDYIDVPVLLDRLSKIVPAGVYLTSISNDKASANARSTVVQVTLSTTKEDSALMQATLDAFKKDSIFHDSYMRSAEMHKESLGDQMAGYKIDWTAQGPGVPSSIDVNKFEFILMANVPKLVDSSGLPVTNDRSIYLADVEFKTPPPPEATDKNGKPAKAGKDGGKSDTGQPEHGSENAPEGVKPVGVN